MARKTNVAGGPAAAGRMFGGLVGPGGVPIGPPTPPAGGDPLGDAPNAPHVPSRGWQAWEDNRRLTSGEGDPFPVGQQGGFTSGTGFSVHPSLGGGFGSRGPSLEDVIANWEASREEFAEAQNRPMGPDSGRFGAFGRAMLESVLSPEGFGDELMRRQMTRLAEREAGLRANEMQAMEGNAAQSGFFDSPTRAGLRGDIAGNSARRLNAAELDFLLQEAGLKSQNRAQSISAAMGLTGIDAQLAQQAAQFAATQQRPLGGGDPFGEGGDFSMLNEDGSLKQFNEDGTPLSDFQRQIALAQRQAFVNQFGG